MFDGQTESPIIHTSKAEESQVKDQSEEGNKIETDEHPFVNVANQVDENKVVDLALEKESISEAPEEPNVSHSQDRTNQQENITLEFEEPKYTLEAQPAEPVSQTFKDEPVVSLDEQLIKRDHVNIIDEQEKENLDRKTTNTKKETSREINKSSAKEIKDNKKRNRFSLLSFYSNYNGSSSSNVVLQQAPTSNVSHSGKRILEPSLEQNVPTQPQDQKRNVSNSSGKSSTSKKSNNSGTAHISSNNGKEASAARKVMDFFKRRSVKIG